MTAEEVGKALGLSRTTLWRLESGGDFPKRRRVSPQRVGWLRAEVMEWALSRPEVGKCPDGADRATTSRETAPHSEQ
ncbi:MAG: AlpA family phage regulatory protein [Gemmatimonadetes bacterium]|nr:AlpA family phage regulatory protein [Gemmatimonadota bacterium]